MTELTLKVNHAAKTVQTTGRVAVGEDVALDLVMDEEVADLAQLRVRLRFMGRDVAVFPFPGSGDEWTEGEAGEDEYTYTGVINLNTVQLNALFAELCDGAVLTCAVVVDQVSNDDGTDDYNVLYGKGALRVWNWGGDLSVTPDVDEAPAPVSLRECLEGKVDKVVTSGAGNVVVFETLVEEGVNPRGVADSGVSISDGPLSSSSTAVPTSRAVKAVTDGLDAAIQTKANASSLANLVTTTQLATKADASVVEDLADGLSNVAAGLADKVDKEDGKGLSSNDFTNALAAKLDGIEAGATNVTVDEDITEDSANAVSSGAVFDMKEHLHQKINSVYTKTEVDAIVAAVKTGSRQVVESLDSVTDPQPLVIYMVAKASAQTSNIYDEYIWLVSEGGGNWEKIGDTEIDLSGYQPIIADLATIRAGAAAGATAVQSVNGETPTDGDVSITGVQIAFGPGVDESITSKINDVANAAVLSVNGKTPTNGEVTLTGDDIPYRASEDYSLADAYDNLALQMSYKAATADLPYALGETITASAQLADRTGNRVVPLAANTENIVLTFPDAVAAHLRDFLALVTNTAGNTGNITFTPPTGATVYGDGFTNSPASGETWLYSVTEVAANTFWAKSVKMEVAQ